VDHHAHHLGGRVELPALLAGAVGEELDQVLVGGDEQVGELEILVAQRLLVEVLDEADQGLVVHGPLAYPAVEVDALEHVLQGVRVLVLDSRQSLVEAGADVLLEVANAIPVSQGRDVEVVLVRVVELLLDQVGG
jgi:hypothetical protein